MNELNDHERAAYTAVDDALYTYPLKPAPVSIMPSVMRQIKTQDAMPRFRLAWIDYALSLFAAGMVGLGLLLWQFVSIPPNLMAKLQIQFLLMWQQFRYGSALTGYALIGGMFLSVAALLAAELIFARGDYITDRQFSG